MCNLIAILESKCRCCEYKHPSGCLRSKYLDKQTEDTHIRYYEDGDGGMTVTLTSKGPAIYLVDIEWCDKWGNTNE